MFLLKVRPFDIMMIKPIIKTVYFNLFRANITPYSHIPQYQDFLLKRFSFISSISCTYMYFTSFVKKSARSGHSSEHTFDFFIEYVKSKRSLLVSRSHLLCVYPIDSI